MSRSTQSFWLTSKGLTVLGLIGALGYFLLMKHWQHVWEFFPYLIFLACPFMHFFMHGHGNHSNHGKSDEEDNH